MYLAKLSSSSTKIDQIDPKLIQKLFIFNLKYTTTHEDLKKFFSTVGIIERNSILYDKWGYSTERAEVKFVKPQNAVQAKNQFNGKKLHRHILEIFLVPVSAKIDDYTIKVEKPECNDLTEFYQIMDKFDIIKLGNTNKKIEMKSIFKFNIDVHESKTGKQFIHVFHNNAMGIWV
uniref:THO complex subunit 4B (Trinotate prediction) n=1 Tax=Myxobolus squamalis TaxID=59785 RepID=A0A6B2G943_MYXSQ